MRCTPFFKVFQPPNVLAGSHGHAAVFASLLMIQLIRCYCDKMLKQVDNVTSSEDKHGMAHKGARKTMSWLTSYTCKETI